MNKFTLTFLILLGVATAGFVTLVLAGQITWFSAQPPLEMLPNLDHQFKSITQSGNTYFSDRKSIREPVEGTVARGEQAYEFGPGDIDLAEASNVDPNLPQTEFVLARGQNQFNIFCSPCHNYDAKSLSKLVQRGAWAGIPDLTRVETVGLSSNRIFHIISAGQNLMPSYADKISVTDRWAIVRYLRTLQGVEPAVTTSAQ